MSRTSRRSFLKKSLVATGGGLIVSGCQAPGGRRMETAPSRVRGANEKIRIGVAGINGRGGSHINGFAGMDNVEVAYLIDPDTRLFDSRAKHVEDKGGHRPQCVQDIRRALDDKTLDAISIATPNHWHALMTLWGCQAGKDVYVEKPMSHNIHEGRMAVEAAVKHGRIVQHGTQSRSSRGRAKVVNAIASGKLGKLRIARGLCYKSSGGFNTRGDLGFKPHTTPPAELDFDLWLGPASKQPYHDNLVHYRWHWFWDFGNGDIGNQGVHQMDIARWAIPGATLPDRVISFGGRLGYSDQGETASSQVAVMDFGETQLIFEVRGLKSKGYRGVTTGNILHLDAGTIVETKFYPEGSKEPVELPDVSDERGPGGGHFENFIAAMRSRKREDLNADILEGHYSAALCHLANISLRLGGKVPFHPRTHDFDDNEAAQDALVRMEQYLSEQNGLKLDQMGYHLGRRLVLNPKAEKFVDDPGADMMLTRCYRKPFVVPDRIA